ncbi:MAG: hypothetical protein IZT58_02455 [Actinobacteria bacterium]|jgi:hypothetical protein|nr:hypothetical protein [Actinomycetota bacterium]
MSDKADTWTINYLPPEGGRYTGKLGVTTDGLRFETLYESSNKTVVKAIFLDVATFTAAGGHTVYRYSNDDEATVELPAAEISAVKAAKKGLMKRAVVTMANGEEFVFDYGMLSVKKLVAAIDAIAGD